MVSRAEALLRQGDVLAARLLFERAAAGGSGAGAVGMGKTYDPRFLASIDARGLKGDPARAIEWYRKAAVDPGNREAADRLRVLGGP